MSVFSEAEVKFHLDAKDEQIAKLKAQLAELHGLAAKHNPRATTPEKAAEFKARAAEVDPVLALERIMKALEPEEASEEELKRINDAWGAWDDERDPHKKAVLQMELAVYVATLLGDGEAKAKRIAELESLVGTGVRDALMQGLELGRAERRGRIAGLRWAIERWGSASAERLEREADRFEAEAKREAPNTDPIVDDEDQVRYPGQQWRVCRRCGALYPPDKACLNDAFHHQKREAGQ